MIKNLLSVSILDNSDVGVVLPATKNETGHWKTNCWQAELSQYKMILTPGYYQSQCDCIKCSMLWNNFGPFMSKTNDLKTYLDPSFETVQEMLVDFFLQIKIFGGKSLLSCPDLMVETKTDIDNNDIKWLKLAQKWKIQGISVDQGPEPLVHFSCEDVNLQCKPFSQTQSFIGKLISEIKFWYTALIVDPF